MASRIYIGFLKLQRSVNSDRMRKRYMRLAGMPNLQAMEFCRAKQNEKYNKHACNKSDNLPRRVRIVVVCVGGWVFALH